MVLGEKDRRYHVYCVHLTVRERYIECSHYLEQARLGKETINTVH